MLSVLYDYLSLTHHTLFFVLNFLSIFFSFPLLYQFTSLVLFYLLSSSPPLLSFLLLLPTPTPFTSLLITLSSFLFPLPSSFPSFSFLFSLFFLSFLFLLFPLDLKGWRREIIETHTVSPFPRGSLVPLPISIPHS